MPEKRRLYILIILIVVLETVQSIAVFGHKKKDEAAREAMVIFYFQYLLLDTFSNIRICRF